MKPALQQDGVQRCCRDCKWFVLSSSSCHKGPPYVRKVIIPGSLPIVGVRIEIAQEELFYAEWPKVSEGDFCGAFDR